MFACEEIPVTIGAGQSVAVSLALEGLAQPPGNLRAFFQVIRINDDVLQGGFTFQQGLEYGNPQDIADTYCCAFDDVHLTIAEVDLRVGTLTMPDVYEDDLPSVVAMNRDYDQGRLDGQSQPLPDCDPNATQLFTDYGDDELVSGHVVLPWSSNATWKMIIPPELRVWRWDQPLQTWWLVESGVSYSASVSGGSFNIKVEGLAPSGVPPYLTVSCQKTDAEGLPLGLPVTDRVLVEVVSIDLEVAEISELDEETWVASMLVNDDYDEENILVYPPLLTTTIVSDNNRAHGQLMPYLSSIVAWDDDLTWASLTIDGPNGQTGKYWIEVVGEPTTVNGAGTGVGEYPGYLQYIRVWTLEGAAIPRTRETAKSITLDAQAVDLLIEGLAKYTDEQHPIKLIAHFEPDGDYVKAGIEADVVDEAMALVGVNGWGRWSDWTGERGLYLGTAIATSDYDTMEQLAKNITGQAGDAYYLWAANPLIDHIEEGTVVDISALLAVFEERLRNNVVEAANAEKKAIFSGTLNYGCGEGVSTETFVNRIFGIGTPAAKLPSFDCLDAIGIIMTRGVIMALLPDEIDAMGLRLANFGIDRWSGDPGTYFNQYDPVVSRGDLQAGDWAEIWNKADYSGGMWGAENTIKVGENYWGFNKKGGVAQSHTKWKEDLVYWYNKENQPSAPITVDDIQGYDDLNKHGVLEHPVCAGFIDVAKLAMKIFDHRKTY